MVHVHAVEVENKILTSGFCSFISQAGSIIDMDFIINRVLRTLNLEGGVP